VITLNKALAQSNPGYKRIGIMGMLALLQQEGATYELLCDAQGTAAGEGTVYCTCASWQLLTQHPKHVVAVHDRLFCMAPLVKYHLCCTH
jgi:hypothetical protein